jgi:hypothetical protein
MLAWLASLRSKWGSTESLPTKMDTPFRLVAKSDFLIGRGVLAAPFA